MSAYREDALSALRAMEHASSPLLHLSCEDRAALVSMFADLAEREPDGSWRTFILKQPFAIGLVDEPAG